MKKVTRFTACILAFFTLALMASGCKDQAYSSYNREGEPYDYYLPDYVKVCEYTNIKVPNLTYTPTEEDIEKAINRDLAVFSPFTRDVDRGCIDGDRVVISTTCYVDDEVYSYLTFKTDSDGEGHSLILGTNEFDVPEIEEALAGMKKGEEKELPFTFPDPYYRDITMSGKEATIKIHIDRIDEIHCLEGTDEFFQERFGYNREGRETELRNNLQKRYNQYLETYKITLTWQYLLDNSKVLKYPEKEYNELYDGMLDNYRAMAENSNMTLKEYVKENLGYADIEDFYAYLKGTAENECLGDMILYYIARREKLNFTSEYYENELLSYCKQFEITDAAEAEEFLAHYNLLSGFQETTRFRYVQEWIAGQAKVLEDVTTVRSSKLK